MEQTIERRWHKIWMEQCEAAETIRLRYGVESAFDYVVGEKLLNFAEAAAEHAGFAQALPQFVSRVRSMFTPEEMATHLPRAERRRRALEEAAADDEGMSIAGERAAAARAAVRPGEGTADRSRPRDVVKPGAGQHPESSDREVLAGLVERVTFHNLENGFCVLRTKARGHRDLVTVVGHAAMVGPGEWITASGEWVNDRTHGDAELGSYASHPAATAGQPTVPCIPAKIAASSALSSRPSRSVFNLPPGLATPG